MITLDEMEAIVDRGNLDEMEHAFHRVQEELSEAPVRRGVFEGRFFMRIDYNMNCWNMSPTLIGFALDHFPEEVTQEWAEKTVRTLESRLEAYESSLGNVGPHSYTDDIDRWHQQRLNALASISMLDNALSSGLPQEVRSR